MSKFRFKFNGPGQHMHDGKMLKKGDEFSVNYDIRKRHADGETRFTLVEKDSQKRRTSGNQTETAETSEADQTDQTQEEKDEDLLSQDSRSNLEIVSKGGGWYDVVDSDTEKAVNETSLRYEDAVALAGE